MSRLNGAPVQETAPKRWKREAVLHANLCYISFPPSPSCSYPYTKRSLRFERFGYTGGGFNDIHTKKTTNHHHDLRHAGDLRRACNVRCVGSKRTPPRKLKSMCVRSLRRIMMPSNPTVLQKGISVCCTTQITLFFCGTIFLLAGQKKIFKVYVS